MNISSNENMFKLHNILYKILINYNIFCNKLF